MDIKQNKGKRLVKKRVYQDEKTGQLYIIVKGKRVYIQLDQAGKIKQQVTKRPKGRGGRGGLRNLNQRQPKEQIEKQIKVGVEAQIKKIKDKKNQYEELQRKIDEKIAKYRQIQQPNEQQLERINQLQNVEQQLLIKNQALLDTVNNVEKKLELQTDKLKQQVDKTIASRSEKKKHQSIIRPDQLRQIQSDLINPIQQQHEIMSNLDLESPSEYGEQSSEPDVESTIQSIQQQIQQINKPKPQGILKNVGYIPPKQQNKQTTFRQFEKRANGNPKDAIIETHGLTGFELSRLINIGISGIDQFQLIFNGDNKMIPLNPKFKKQIVIFSKALDPKIPDYKHYTVLVHDNQNELAFFDPLALPESYKQNEKQIENIALQIDPENEIKIKVNKIPWQQNIEKYEDVDSKFCGFYVFAFLHNYINNEESFKEASEFDKDDEQVIDKITKFKSI